MGTGQMLLVMMAVILFSTIFLTMYSNIDEQGRVIEKARTMLQGQKVADSYFQKIGAELIGGVETFSDVNNFYKNFTETVQVNGNTYNVTCERSIYCTQIGTPSAGDIGFQLIEFSIWVKNAYQDSVVIGTPANPLQKVFARMEF